MKNELVSFAQFTLNGTNIFECSSYVYLGREINTMNDLAPELSRKKRAAWGAFKSIEDVVKRTKNTRLCDHLFDSTVLPALTYASETWSLRKPDERSLSVIERAVERTMLGVSRFTQIRDMIRISDLRQRPIIKDAVLYSKRSKIRWAGHVMRMNDNRWTRSVSDWISRDVKRTAVPDLIKITLPNGKQFDAESWRTTPLQIAEKISKGLAENTVIAKVNGEVWDLDRPFECDSTLHLLKFDDDDAKQVFWHSSAHILGEAMERYCGGHLCYGPPVEEGFYYDMWHEHLTVSQEDFPKIEEIVKCAIKDKQPFERLEMTKENLLEMFKYNEFKVRIIKQKINTPTTTVYRCGPLIDLCRGPHVRHTGKIKAEAAKRDHRKLGREQELFFFNHLSPGSAFWYPKGAHIYNTLVNFIRKEYRKRGFTEVITPNMYNSQLWETSGHWKHYSEDMFRFEIEKEQFGLKPMNCPGHCLMYAHQPHAYNELPIRYADFGVLHRNEMSGALSGLTRVRRFQQDDAHIFCRRDQIGSEIKGCLDFLSFCYEEVFGFTFKLNLSTRPEGFLGEISTWDEAESDLKAALDESGRPWSLNEGDGAFYGPK
uniref:threonine--tRNA ligase n=1 Tax=Angiostrongylus cantonensis TaxID=6313 RepID=A0A0K0D5A7_ANGCA